MTTVRRPDEIHEPEPALRLVVELPWWPRVFCGNLRDLLFPRRLPPLELRSAPAPYWPDVFVGRELPWKSLLKSSACHVAALTLLIGFTRLFSLQPQAVAQRSFDHAQVVYYEPSAYLPPIDTRNAESARPRKADPEFSRQPIISVPPEADNRSQTIVTPPDIKIKHDRALPNVVAWSDMAEKIEKPRLAIPPAPMTPAADITRLPPQLQSSVVTPPPDAARLTHRRDAPALRESVVAPPPDLRAANAAAALQPLQAAVVAPPPSVDMASSRLMGDPVGDLNIGRSAVIAPAPQLPLAEQRAIAGSRSPSGGAGAQVVPPPPSIAGAESSREMAGARGRFIALNLHPAVGAPADPPAGNRRGAFAATPEGRAGASGAPGAEAAGNAENGSGSVRKGSSNPASNLPAGLYVGSAGARPSAVAGDPAGKASENSVEPKVVASVRLPRVTTAPTQSESTSKLSEAERAVFGDRKFYSLRLNIPNLNSNGGSWVIRFAELDHDSDSRDANSRDSKNSDPNKFGSGKFGSEHNDASPAGELSQPVARRTVDPAYPMQLMRKNVAGTVILYAVIHADGTVGNVRVLRGVDDRLDQFASQAVAQWQFQPATRNGVPVDVEATFQVPFRPARAGSNSSW